MAFRILLGTILPVLVYAVVAAPLLWWGTEGINREAGGFLLLIVVILGLGYLLTGIAWLVWAILIECVRRWAETRYESTGVLLAYLLAGAVLGCLVGLSLGLYEFEWPLEIWRGVALPGAVVGAIVPLLLWRFAGANR